jgi:hypothetical protein
MAGTTLKALSISEKRKDRSKGTTAWRTPVGKNRCEHGAQIPCDTQVSPGSPSTTVVPHHAHTTRIWGWMLP